IPPLTLHLVTQHPQEAAGVLQQLAVEDTAAFLESLPREMGSRLLDRLTPQYASQCILALSPEASGPIVQGMKSASAASIFRIIPRSAMNSLLGLLTPEKKSLLERRLALPYHSVGAWTDSDNPPIPETTLVGDLRRLLRKSKKVVEYSPCVIKEDGSIAGVLHLSKLAVAKEGTPVSKIMDTVFKSVSDRDSLQSVASLPDWNRFDALPVMNRRDKFVGMLTHKNLLKGLSVETGKVSDATADSILTECISAYTSTLSWLVQSVLPSSDDPPNISGKR
ncbi:MAG: magnesium transporter, partial [Nitrospinaceae bacterium]|nr:magnesium transporter [Nitrospinaceae bacterium]NIT84961.1 magnesium transporter [Nitrospinaceae bacterium]